MEVLFSFFADPWLMVMVCVGTVCGILVGAMPGLTGAMLIALSLPLTFSMSSASAMVLLISMYVGSVSGGLVTATLLKIPGTPASMMTTFDGYPLAQKGQANRALGLGVVASFVGGLIGWVFLILLSAPLAKLSLMLGPFEYFSLVLVALVLIGAVSGKSIWRGLFAGFMGLAFSLPGVDPANGTPRLTFGFAAMEDGLKLLPVLIGLFAISQVMQDIARSPETGEALQTGSGGRLRSFLDSGKHLVNLGRSSIIGTFVGILPGVGANIGSVVAYSTAKSFSKRPEDFGHGSEEGIIASEAANNASVGGALIPLFAMGIPGSVIDAILLGALTIHGLQPGPLLIEQNPQLFGIVMVAFLFANLAMCLIMLAAAPHLALLARIPKSILSPTILTLCVLGSFALANRMFDVWIMLAMGALGLIMNRLRIPLAPFVIGFVLAPVAESHLTEGLMQSGGSWLPLITRPVSIVLILAAVVLFVVSIIQNIRLHRTIGTPDN